MGGFSNWPNFDLFISQCWGPSNPESSGTLFSAASNIVVGTNPPYTVTDFLAFYPKFGGRATPIQGIPTSGSAVVTGVASDLLTNGAAVGQLVSGAGIPSGTAIFSINSASSLTLTQPASVGETVTLSLYTAPLLPMVVLAAYVALATASLVQARWRDMWAIAMGLYVAHFATLYLRSDGDVNCTPGQAAAAGLQRGITVSKSAGPGSQGVQPITGLDSWAAWTATEYGLQYATFARVIGMGAMLVV